MRRSFFLKTGAILLLPMLLCGCVDASSAVPAETAEVTAEETIYEETTASGFPDDSERSIESESVPETEALTEESEAAEQDTLTLRMVGDILLHTPVEEASLREDGTYDYSAIFAHTADLIGEADLSLVNQEVIIGGAELGVSGYPAFNAPYDIADALVDAGFDVICHATNHALDKGKKGILNTLSNWEEAHPDITVLGIYDNEADSEEIPLVSVNGITLAILNYTYGTNGIALPSDMPYCVELLDKEKVITDLDQAEDLADFTIVCPHWGVEYSLTPSQDQENWCKLFLDHGADLVLGTHPHVIEPVTVMEDDAGHSMVVYYSLGNFVNWTSGTGTGVANRMVGGMADVTLERDEDGTVRVSDYGVIPLICHVRSEQDGVTVYPLGEYNETLGNENEIRSQDSAFSYDYCRELTESIWGEVVRK